MNDPYVLARFLKEHREAKGLNPRQLSELIRSAGGSASMQAIQQWENTNPEQRTTRPGTANRRAIVHVLKCDADKLEAAYHEAREAARAGGLEDAQLNAMPVLRLNREATIARAKPLRPSSMHFGLMLKQAITERMPVNPEYFDRRVSLFNVSRAYDYLSSDLCVEWAIGVPQSPYFNRSSVEARLYRLLWLAMVDNSTSVDRDYVLLLFLPLDLAADEQARREAETSVTRMVDSLSDELKIAGMRIDVAFADSLPRAADIIVRAER